MLKKVSHIVISILLLIATTGFTSMRHYCGEELISNGLIPEQSGCCDESSTLCHDEALSYHIEGDFFSVYYDYDFGQIPYSLPLLKGMVEYRSSQTTDPINLTENLLLPLKIQMLLSSLQVFIL